MRRGDSARWCVPSGDTDFTAKYYFMLLSEVSKLPLALRVTAPHKKHALYR